MLKLDKLGLIQLLGYIVVLSWWWALPWITTVGYIHSHIYMERLCAYIMWIAVGVSTTFILLKPYVR